MKAYGKRFSDVYNLMWGGFAKTIGPRVHEFYMATPIGHESKNVLDLCCGTGHLSTYLLAQGYRVVGIDLSEHMLRHARENAAEFVKSGQCAFVQADATSFLLGERFGLVLSTFDSLNHLRDMHAMRRCFEHVLAVCDGYFVFDLNTRRGLFRSNDVHVDDSNESVFLATRGMFDEQSDIAWTRISGFIRTEGECFQRFEETVRSTAFGMQAVRDALLETGWQEVYFAPVSDLHTRLDDPEREARVFVVAAVQRQFERNQGGQR